jgi:putative acetyltransferase
VIVRAAAPADETVIRAVVSAAFGRPDEADIVEGVRAAGETLVELLAEEGGAISGHILFCRTTCVPETLLAALGPLAVRPSRQRRGIGSPLVESGLEGCRSVGAAGCVVLGAPDFYGRFGFARAGSKLRSPFSHLEAFLELEFRAGALSRITSVAYPAAFG